ncbi:energy-coupling factor transporter ATPase [Paenibacillus crassostreae]|uniref:Energy-coupling factor transporter ATP-binding protein EcfA2 n=1 Tax=Paenibacillus crassostreae TaxID=1763538 RepID=A0A167BSS6_9BACL|nr:energy-coupling factor transporter ATPase [Paenibacillus crassostreae]AOZ92457.1 energy-coupling factor transporter ATPase [Paenibacillus crassostreae]OAB72405.1 ABC transporter ATP-binding protein [Paenibacillus crassostreae]
MAITFKQVNYEYDANSMWRQAALQGVDLQIESGTLVGIAGATGSGKSTLLQMFNGILKPSSGSVQVLDVTMVAGEKSPKLKQLRKRVGLVFQFPEQQLFEDTVEKDLCFGPMNFGISLEEAKDRARVAMERMGMDLELLSRNPFQLSGGQMRKVAIASVLAMDPDILVLDEPTATLDPVSRAELIQLLYRLCRDDGRTVIIVTHRMDELLPFADQWLVLHEGRTVFQGTVKALVEQADQMEQYGVAIPQSIRYWRALSEEFGWSNEEPCLSAEAIAKRIVREANLKIAPGEEGSL